ncbi:MAG: TRAP transporter large permease [Synergistota bacterium]|nr:TRAP transporter large permease [Synergistota bacterium]
MITFLIISLFIMMGIGVPIFVALSFSSIMATVFFSDFPIGITVQRLLAGIDKFSLMSMPFYIFAANIMEKGGMSRRLLDWVDSIFGSFSGSTALTTQGACMFFGALSGSSPATVSAIGALMYPELLKNNYSKSFSVGLISASGAVAILIPPSITMIVFGATTGVSVGGLFIGGIGAGLIYGFSILAYSYYYARKKNIPTLGRFNFSRFLLLTKEAAWSLGVPVIILGGIFTGAFTPTEAAGVSVVYVILITSFVYRELDFRKLYEVCIESSVTIAQVMILLAAASLFGWVLTVSFIPQMAASAIASFVDSKIMMLIIINILFLIAGMFMDGSAAIMILVPVLFKPCVDFGIDPVHLGVILVSNICIGMFTPPFGLNLFVASQVTGLSVSKIAPAIIPFFFVCLISLLIITYVPAISLFLPALAGF